MKSFIITVHLPGVSTQLDPRAHVMILAPSGDLHHRQLNMKATNKLKDMHDYCGQLVKDAFPGYRNKVHGTQLCWEGPFLSSGLVSVVRVDVED